MCYADCSMLERQPLSRKFKSYVGHKIAAAKLTRYLTDFHFTDIRTATQQIKQDEHPVEEL